MTEHHDITLSHDILSPILDTGLQGLPEAISLLINHAMLIERSKHLGAAPYQREPARTGHAKIPRDYRDRLHPIAHLILNARYEKVRTAGLVRSCDVFPAIGIRKDDGKRTTVGTSVSACSVRSVIARGYDICDFRGRGSVH